MTPKKIAVIQRHLVFYRDRIFSQLAHSYKTTFLHSGISFEGFPLPEHLPTIECKTFFFRWKHKRKMLWMTTALPLMHLKPQVIITEATIALLSTWLLFILRPLFRWKIIFWTHGFEHFWRTKPHLTFGDKIRKLMFNSADAIVTYGGRGTSELRSLLRNNHRIYEAPNTLDTERIHTERIQLEAKGRKEIQLQLGMTDFTMVLLGRLSPEKEILNIPPLIRNLVASGIHCQLHIIGDGRLKKALAHEMNQISGCKTVFHGSLTHMNEKAPILFGADCMIGTGAQGLSVVEAFGFGCPMVTLHEKNLLIKHGPEVQYIHDGQNGIIAKSLDDMAAKLKAFAESPSSQDAFRNATLDTFQNECDISLQWKGLSLAIKDCLNAHPL